MSTPDDLKALREAERAPRWFKPQRRRSTLYEDVTVDVQPSIDRHTIFGYFHAFPDGRPTYWDSTALRSEDWYAFRDPGELWERSFYQAGARHEQEIADTLQVARDNQLYARFAPGWVKFLSAHIVPVSLAEYGLTAPLTSAFRPALSDTVGNCLSFQAGFKLRQGQALILYTMDLDQCLPGFPTTAEGKQRFLEEPAWQPTRRYLERLATVTDWNEIIVAANLCFEPLVGVFLRRELLMGLASRGGDLVTPTFGRVAQAEWAWSRTWTTAFMRLVLDDPTSGPANARQVAEWLLDWIPPALEAVDALGAIASAVADESFGDGRGRVQEEFISLLSDCGLLTAEVEKVVR